MSKKRTRQKSKIRNPLPRLKSLFRQKTSRDLLWYHQAGECVERLHPQDGDRRYGDSRMQSIAKSLNQPGGNVNSLATLLRYYRTFYNEYDRVEVARLCEADPAKGFMLSWTHVLKLSSVAKPLRDRLQKQCIKNRWPTAKLQEVIETKQGGKKSKGGRRISPPKSRVDNLQQLIKTSEDWLRRFDGVWFGGITALHEGKPSTGELAKLRKLFKSAQARMTEMSTKTKKGKRHLEKLETKIR